MVSLKRVDSLGVLKLEHANDFSRLVDDTNTRRTVSVTGVFSIVRAPRIAVPAPLAFFQYLQKAHERVPSSATRAVFWIIVLLLS